MAAQKTASTRPRVASGKRSASTVGAEPCRANVWLDCGQHLPVDVIEKIDAQEQPECGARAGQWFSRTGFHRQLPIAVRGALIVNHKPCPRYRPANARFISLLAR